MMKINHNNEYTLKSYITWLLIKYKELHGELAKRETYRIESVEAEKYGNKTLNIHILGAGKIFKATPEVIVNDDELLEGFSKKDIRIIVYLATQNNASERYAIDGFKFSKLLEKHILTVVDKSNKKVIAKSAQDIALDKSYIQKMSAADAYKVGYLLGSESVIAEANGKLAAEDFE